MDFDGPRGRLSRRWQQLTWIQCSQAVLRPASESNFTIPLVCMSKIYLFAQGNVFVCFDPARFQEQVKKCPMLYAVFGNTLDCLCVRPGTPESLSRLQRSFVAMAFPTSTPATILPRSSASNARIVQSFSSFLRHQRLYLSTVNLNHRAPQDFPSVSFKPLRKPFKSYFKSFANMADVLNENHIIKLLCLDLSVHLWRRSIEKESKNPRRFQAKPLNFDCLPSLPTSLTKIWTIFNQGSSRSPLQHTELRERNCELCSKKTTHGKVNHGKLYIHQKTQRFQEFKDLPVR